MRLWQTHNTTSKMLHWLLACLLGAGMFMALHLNGYRAAAQDDSTPTPTATPTLPPDALLPAYGTLVDVCDVGGLQPRSMDFAAQGYILTTFSRDAMWVVEVAQDRRYPLPDSRPCGPNCVPSPDRRALLYISAETNTFWMMNVDGTARHEVIPLRALSVDWWDADHWLVWNNMGAPFILPIGAPLEQAQTLDTPGIFSVQPGGLYALKLIHGEGDEGDPVLELLNMESEAARPLAVVHPYFGGAYWSPDGSRLAYIGYGETDPGLHLRGAELYLTQPGQTSATRLTDLSGAYGAVRIAGEQEEHAVSWSPDGRYLAFWVFEIIGPDIGANVGHAVIHMVDTASGEVRAFCGYASNDQSPNPPALIWSPDSRYIAFGVDEPGDERASLLIVLDTETGIYTQLTEGMYAAYGTYDPVMWGLQ